jgi:hypothetical protein
MTLYNEILARRPDLLPALFEPFATDRRGEVPDGMQPWFDIPVFNWHAGRLSCIYVRQYIEAAQRKLSRRTQAHARSNRGDGRDGPAGERPAASPFDGVHARRHPAPAQPPDPAFPQRLRELAGARTPSPPAAAVARATDRTAASRRLRAALRQGGPGDRGGIVVRGTTRSVVLEAE